MSELDEFWSNSLSEAAKEARISGRKDVADYLDLKLTNDTTRTAAVEALFEAAIFAANAEEYRHLQIRVERTNAHSFHHRHANLVGTMLTIRHGLRCMTVEAGWTRTPKDGFMRLQALVFARITHFGMSEANLELVLHAADSGHVWKTVREDRAAEAFSLETLAGHLKLLTGMR